MALIQQKFQNIGSGDLSSTASRPHNTLQSVSIDFENSQHSTFQPLHCIGAFFGWTLRTMKGLRNSWKPLKPQKSSQNSSQLRSKKMDGMQLFTE